MKLLEKVLAFGILIALILKFSLISGSDVLLFCATVTLACIYYPLGFLFFNQIRLRHVFKKAAYKNVSVPRIIFAIVTGIGLSAICLGANYRLFNYTGADTILLNGLIVTALMLVFSLIRFVRYNDTNSKYALWRICIIGGIGIVLMFTSHLSIVKFQYRNYPDYIEAYSNYLGDRDSEELLKKVELERNRIRMTEGEFRDYQEAIDNKTKN